MRADGDTIAAIATPPGQGGIAIIRLSGPGAIGIVAGLFARRDGGTVDEPRRVFVGRLLERPGGSAIDEVLVFTMPAPHSYTGEDVAEIQCHGGTLVSQGVLESVLAAGARPAGPGEFTRRAFLNGRLDLAQAEAVADLIAARTEAGRRLAWSQLDGVLSRRVEVLRERIVQVRAFCEAAIDFPEDDVPEIVSGELAADIDQVRGEIARLLDGFERARVRYEGARAVLIGKPNVGKSSLLNAFAGRDRAIVTPVAGTTRDIVEVVVALADGPLVVADTAGLRDTMDPIEVLGASRARAALDDADCAIVVLDGARTLDDDDRLVIEAARGTRAIVAVNKCDLPRSIAVDEIRKLAGPWAIHEVSATTGRGLPALIESLGRLLFGGGASSGMESEVGIFRVRHKNAAERAARDLGRASQLLASAGALELIASDLASAADALAEITGAITPEDILDRVFAEFCIGK